MQSSISCLYLVAGGFFMPRHRRLLYALCEHFGFEKEPIVSPASARPMATVPTVTVTDEVGECPSVQLAEIVEADGNISLLELVVIVSLVRRLRPQLSFEIGTFDGRTTLNIALNQEPGSQVMTLDLPRDGLSRVQLPLANADRKFIDKPASGMRFAGKPTPAQITQLYGDSSTYDFAPYHGMVDLMFVDGSHSYDYVKSDTEAALRMVHERGGVIIWHDYDTPYWWGVTQALNELQASHASCAGIRHVAGTSLCVLERRPRGC